MFIGDTHANTTFMRECFDLARELGINHLIQVGDFGFGLRAAKDENGGLKTLDEIESLFDELDCRGLHLGVVRGNHDKPGDGVDNTGWRAWLPLTCGDTGRVEEWYRTSPLTVFQDGDVFQLGSKTVGVMGGAISTDQDERVEGESYWRDEVISRGQMERALDYTEPIDIMISHDSPEYPPQITPWSVSEKVAHLQDLNRYRLGRVFDRWKPRIHIHGHFHYSYSAPTLYGMRYGLASDHSPISQVVRVMEV